MAIWVDREVVLLFFFYVCVFSQNTLVHVSRFLSFLDLRLCLDSRFHFLEELVGAWSAGGGITVGLGITTLLATVGRSESGHRLSSLNFLLHGERNDVSFYL